MSQSIKHGVMFLSLAVMFILCSHSVSAQFLQQGPKLVGSGAVGAASQGKSVSLSADGNTAIVGGYVDNSYAGAAWVYTRSGGVWTQQGSRLVGAGAFGSAWQGFSVSLSADGNTAIVGGHEDNSGAGAAWVYTRSGGVWTQQGPKLVGTGAVDTAWQGSSVSLSADGNTAIVGGPWDNGGAGAAWVFIRSGGVWTQQGSKLVGTTDNPTAFQGYSVSLSADGNTAIVGGIYDSVGAAWVYTRSGGVWTQQGSKLVGTGAVGIAFQGTSVSLSADGNTAIVGGSHDKYGPGAAWIYARSGGVWTQQGGKLVGTGAVGDANQGTSVSLSADGNTAFLGGPADNSGAGALWVFTRSGGVWTQQGSKLVGTGAVGVANQGTSVSLSADANTAMVGGVGDNSGAGAVWVYASERKPVITGILDVPGDQGGQVRLMWERSVYDDISLSPQVTSYSIFRKGSAGNVPGKAGLRLPEVLTTDTNLVGYDYLGDVPALQLSQYQTVVSTLEDSSSSGSALTTFLVIARTEDIDQYHVSDPDSGYSVDNLSPIPPSGLVAIAESGPQVGLTWDSPTDPDVGQYLVYRSTTSGFTPGAGTYLGSSKTTSYTDVSPDVGSTDYYRLVAVDVHGNKSGPSAEASAPVSVEQAFSVQTNWNMVSVPQKVSDYTKSVLFPTATSNAFTYEAGYVAYGTLENGKGYWLKFNSAQTITQSGLSRTEDTVDVQEGWNMIGALSVGITTSGIGSIPGGLVTSPFYQYTGSYTDATTLEPGKGYWVKVSQAGQLVMTSSGNLPEGSRIRIDESGERPPAPPDGMPPNPVPAIPHRFMLGQNYPNPFNPATTIRYDLPVESRVTINVFDIFGQIIDVLKDEYETAGYRSVTWEASRYPSGVYYCRIEAVSQNSTFVRSQKMLLIK